MIKQETNNAIVSPLCCLSQGSRKVPVVGIYYFTRKLRIDIGPIFQKHSDQFFITASRCSRENTLTGLIICVDVRAVFQKDLRNIETARYSGCAQGRSVISSVDVGVSAMSQEKLHCIAIAI